MLAAGVEVDLVLARAQATIHQVGRRQRRQARGQAHAHGAAARLARYLRQSRPDALLAAKERAIRVARRAGFSGWRGPLAGRLGTTVSAALIEVLN